MACVAAKRVFAMSVQQPSATERTVALALRDVMQRVDSALQRGGRTTQPRLVAVSKTKPAAAVQEAYDAGQRVFGENYVQPYQQQHQQPGRGHQQIAVRTDSSKFGGTQELLDKAPLLPADIQWHFIGHLQSNKVKALLEGVANLSMVETVDSSKLADRLNRIAEGLSRPSKLSVMIQVNTSGEETKYGCDPSEVVGLAQHVAQHCPALNLAGLMTIGQPDYSSRPENFTCLAECRSGVAEALGVPESSLELSMGMSGDFEQAIEMGSTNIRVGSTIFGARDYSAKQ